MLCDSESQDWVEKSLQKADKVFVQDSFMPLSDPKDRFKRVTRTDFVLNKSSLHSQSKKACAAGRLDGMEERGGTDKRSYLRRAYKCQYVWARVCVCDTVLLCDFKAGRMRGLPGDTGHLSHSCFIFDAQTHTHTGTHLSATKSLAAALTASQWLDSQMAALVAWHHHNSKIPAGSFGTRSSSSAPFQSQVNGRRSPNDEEEGLGERQ